MSKANLARRLSELVAFDTQNPMGDERPMAQHLAQQLAGLGADRVDSFTVGRHHAVLALFGASPSLLLNAHIDTVPANTGYSAPPHAASVRNGRLYGLGSADTKGAIAVILQALADLQVAGRRPRDVAVLFSGDEEKHATVARAFIASERARGLQRAIVCEPTLCRVGHRHRGIASAEAFATSPGGHSSRADDLPSPLAIIARAAVALDQHGQQQRAVGPEGFRGLCLNIAALDGGVAFNVIPSQARLAVSLRPAPGADTRGLMAELERIARQAAAPAELRWQAVHANPPFATRDLAAFVPLLGDRARQPVDLAFWTEAALYGEAGIDAVVFGPGDIAQAHAADEFVELAQLEAAHATFLKVLA
jgi:acetylornithine deacetylase